MISSILALSSCAKDPCIDTTCYNNGVCNDGTCICADWYEGVDCSTEEREKYFGIYLGTAQLFDSDNNLVNTSVSSLTLSAGNTINVITGDGQFPLVLSSSGSGSYDIPVTQIYDADLGGNIYLQGSGTLTSSTATMIAQMEFQGDILLYSFTGNK
jgi:hypothetical protein